ncbi:hypothetical protein OHD26_27550 [Escherichia coli]|nr:hypothetical protein [Escherichia coli]
MNYYPRSHHPGAVKRLRKTHVQRHLGRQPETGIQQQPGLVPVDMLTHPRYGMWKRLGRRM